MRRRRPAGWSAEAEAEAEAETEAEAEPEPEPEAEARRTLGAFATPEVAKAPSASAYPARALTQTELTAVFVARYAYLASHCNRSQRVGS
jgi:hypothetical protein